MRPQDIPQAVADADLAIRPHVLETPLRRSDDLSHATGAEVLCKLENVQVTGSFKARGAANKLAKLSLEERQRGVVTASSGNHGAAFSAAMARLGGRGIVFLPSTTPAVKVDAIRMRGAEIRFHSEDSGEAELAAIAFAREAGLSYVSPYDDPDIIAGQGTIGAEIARQTPQVDHLFISVGGGGLISGVAGYLKPRFPGVTVWGVSPVNDHAMKLSAAAGVATAHVDAAPTLSDGTAGGVAPGAITVPLCRALVDHWPLVSEAEIASAMRRYIANESQLIEGAAGVAIAGFLKEAAAAPERFRGRTVAIVICGGRIDATKLVKVLGGKMAQ